MPAIHVPPVLQRSRYEPGDDDRVDTRRLEPVKRDLVAIMDAGARHEVAVEANDASAGGVLNDQTRTLQ